MARVDMKVVLLGKEFCGKTSLVERYLNDRFAGENRYQNTIGAAYGAKMLTLEDREITIGIWDTAGSERYESMSRIYYRGAKAAVVCYSVNDQESWDRLKFWINELQKLEKDCKIYLCATKVDLLQGDNKKRAVDYHNTTDYADEIGADVFETSSKTGENISEMFLKIAKDYAENPRNNLESFRDSTISLSKSSKKRKACCGRRLPVINPPVTRANECDINLQKYN